MPRRFQLLLLIAPVILILDQASKLYIDNNFARYESVTVLRDYFHITYLRNQGAAFGILAESALRRPFFITVAILAAAGILYYLYRSEERQRLLHISLALIFAGAIGNLIDRIRLGERGAHHRREQSRRADAGVRCTR